MNMRLLWRWWLILLGMLVMRQGMAAETLFLGVQDYNRSPIVVAEEFRGLATYLSRVLQRPVKIETVRDYDKYLAEAKQKRFAFMFAPPSMIMQANKLAGYEPVAKIPGQISAGFMTPVSTGIAFPEDMKGKRIGFTDQKSMVTQLALAELRRKKIDPATYFKSVAYYHDVDGIVTAFKYKLIDIGVANTGIMNLWNNSGMDINLIMQSTAVPHLTFAVRADLPAGIKHSVAQALVSANTDQDAQSYFANTGFAGFEAASLADYKDIVLLLNIR